MHFAYRPFAGEGAEGQPHAASAHAQPRGSRSAADDDRAPIFARHPIDIADPSDYDHGDGEYGEHANAFGDIDPDERLRNPHAKPQLRTIYNKPVHRVVFSPLMLIACIAMFVYTIALNGWTIAPIEQNPMLGPTASVLVRAGAKDVARIRRDGEWQRLILPMFLHGGLLHLMCAHADEQSIRAQS